MMASDTQGPICEEAAGANWERLGALGMAWTDVTLFNSFLRFFFFWGGGARRGKEELQVWRQELKIF